MFYSLLGGDGSVKRATRSWKRATKGKSCRMAAPGPSTREIMRRVSVDPARPGARLRARLCARRTFRRHKDAEELGVDGEVGVREVCAHEVVAVGGEQVGHGVDGAPELRGQGGQGHGACERERERARLGTRADRGRTILRWASRGRRPMPCVLMVDWMLLWTRYRPSAVRKNLFGAHPAGGWLSACGTIRRRSPNVPRIVLQKARQELGRVGS